jgi:hypothetical protein
MRVIFELRADGVYVASGVELIEPESTVSLAGW